MTQERTLGAAEVAKRHKSAAPPPGGLKALLDPILSLGEPQSPKKGPSSKSIVKNEAAATIAISTPTATDPPFAWAHVVWLQMMCVSAPVP